MGKYCTAEAVKLRLASKVKFSAGGEEDENKMSQQLLATLISEAESQLEIDLMDRYEIPFQGVGGVAFANLPESSRVTLKNLAELISVIRVLETDFGRGTSVNSDKYTDKLQKRYDGVIAQLMAIKNDSEKNSRGWVRRPLDGVAVSYNNQGDNGFRGRVMNTSGGATAATYAETQLNDPSENFFNGIIEPFNHE